MPENLKIQLKDSDNNLLYPRTTIDNVVVAAGSTVSVSVPFLDGTGKIPAVYLPSFVDDIVHVVKKIDSTLSTSEDADVAAANAVPSTTGLAANIDHYIDDTASSKKVYTVIKGANNTLVWDSGASPTTGVIYALEDSANNKIYSYRWDGSAFVPIASQYAVRTDLRLQGADDNFVPTEKAVADKIIQLTGGTAFTLEPASSGNLGGIKVDGTVFQVNSTTDYLEAVSITATTWDALNSDSTDKARLVTGAKLLQIVNGKLTGYQVSLNEGTGIDIFENLGTTYIGLDKTAGARYDIKYETV
jgi:hypothetical protein